MLKAIDISREASAAWGIGHIHDFLYCILHRIGQIESTLYLLSLRLQCRQGFWLRYGNLLIQIRLASLEGSNLIFNVFCGRLYSLLLA